MRDGELPLEVGVLNPELGKDPVLRTIARGPDGVVRCWLLFELNGEWNEVAIAADVEQHEGRSDVAVISVAMDGRNVL